MKNKKSLNNIFVIFATVLAVFTLSGCSPSIENLAKWGNQAYNKGDYLYAVGCYKGVLLQQPYNMSVNHWLGKSYLVTSNGERAKDYFNKVIESNSADANTVKVQSYISLAQAYYQNGEYQKALESYKAANNIKPGTDLENLSLYTDVYDVNNQIKAAIDLQKRYNYSQEYLSRQYRVLSYLYNRDHNYDEASKMALKSIEAYPDNEMAYYFAGIASGQKGQYEKAVETIRKATKVQSSNINQDEYLPIYISLAYFLNKNGQSDEAVAAFNQAIQSAANKTSYDNYSFVMAKTLAYYNAGKYDEALFTINKFITPLDKGKIGVFFRDSVTLKNSYGDKNYYIFDVIKNSPAEKAGLRFGDKIIEINNISTKDWSVNKIAENLSGTEGTKVTLKIQRNPEFAKYLYKDKVKKEIVEKTLIREQLSNNKQKKDLANACGIRSLIYRAKGDNVKASVEAEKAYSFSSEAINAKLAYGLSKLDKGNYNAALDTLSSISPAMIENARLYNFSFLYFFIPFPSDEEHIRLGKALAYAKLGRVNEAMSLIPDNMTSQLPPLKNDYLVLSDTFNTIAQAHEQTAVNFEREGNFKRALDEYTVAIAFNNNENKDKMLRKNVFNIVHQLPSLPPISENTRKHVIRAEVLREQNDLQGCLREYQNALKSAPYMPKLYYNTATIYGELKNYEKAINYMKNYIDLAMEAPNLQDAKDEITKWELLKEKADI